MKRVLLLIAVVLCACAAPGNNNGINGGAPVEDIKPALDAITGERILSHIKRLASDEFEGRAPGTKGEELTVNYLVDQFKQLGLKPGNNDGSYIQNVPLIGFKAQPTLAFNAGGKNIALTAPDDYVAASRRGQPEIAVKESEIVFVGYGIVAPEYGWDDYKGVDVTGKTILMLINDPQIPDAQDGSKLDERMFKGRAMTYYGRWTYKFEIASEKGAAAAIIVHETEPAGYAFSVVRNGWSGENFDIKADNSKRVAVESWLTLERAKELLAAVGQDFDALKRAANTKEFKPVALSARANFTIKNSLRDVASRNVIAKLEGSDARLKSECIIYSAHWDAFGRNESLTGDQIFNGALDNASGVAEVMEIAGAFTTLKTAPKRTILFLIPTAEENGLLGAKYYANNPVFPHERTLANINLDIMNVWGRTRAIVSVAYGTSTLDELLAELAARQGRVVKPDPEPEKGYFYRSDHFELVKKGVPALTFLHSGADYLDKPADYGQRKRNEYVGNDYHKVTDEVKPDWDMAGAVEDTRLLFEAGYRVAQGDKFPEWKPGAEFKARREQSLKR